MRTQFRGCNYVVRDRRGRVKLRTNSPQAARRVADATSGATVEARTRALATWYVTPSGWTFGRDEYPADSRVTP